MKSTAVLEAQMKGKAGKSLYSILDDFCRNKASGKKMPQKNWPSGNTKIARYPTLSVVLHSTVIVETAPDGRITLNSGGYRTVTTKARINEFLDLANTGWRVQQVKGVWHLYHYVDGNVDVDAIFSDGIAIEPVYDVKSDLCMYCEAEIEYKDWCGQMEWVIDGESYCIDAPYDETKGHEGQWHKPIPSFLTSEPMNLGVIVDEVPMHFKGADIPLPNAKLAAKMLEGIKMKEWYAAKSTAKLIEATNFDPEFEKLLAEEEAIEAALNPDCDELAAEAEANGLVNAHCNPHEAEGPIEALCCSYHYPAAGS